MRDTDVKKRGGKFARYCVFLLMLAVCFYRIQNHLIAEWPNTIDSFINKKNIPSSFDDENDRGFWDYKKKRREARTIRTFYHDIGNHEQQRQVDTWAKYWKDMGWEVKVLGMEDAKRHPLYSVIKERIDKLQMCSNPDFQRLCFTRWLAMAADGGGFMSDYDILPLDFPPQYDSLPNGGKFTSYDHQLAPFTSSNQEDITRILITMLQTVEEHSILRTRGTECRDGTWQITDQESLLILQKKILNGEMAPDTLFFPRPRLDPGFTIHADDFIQRITVNENDCPMEYKTVHFSGRHGQLKRDVRLRYMENAYQVWMDECSNHRIFDSPEKDMAQSMAQTRWDKLVEVNDKFRSNLQRKHDGKVKFIQNQVMKRLRYNKSNDKRTKRQRENMKKHQAPIQKSPESKPIPSTVNKISENGPGPVTPNIDPASPATITKEQDLSQTSTQIESTNNAQNQPTGTPVHR